jgi:hypothetical protein
MKGHTRITTVLARLPLVVILCRHIWHDRKVWDRSFGLIDDICKPGCGDAGRLGEYRLLLHFSPL